MPVLSSDVQLNSIVVALVIKDYPKQGNRMMSNKAILDVLLSIKGIIFVSTSKDSNKQTNQESCCDLETNS